MRVDQLTDPLPLLNLGEVKAHLRITHDAEDLFIEHLLIAATQAAENYCRRAFMPRVSALVLDAFPAGVIELPMPPTIEVDSILYLAPDGELEPLDESAYTVSIPVGPKAGRARLAPVTSWPETARMLDAVRIVFRAGSVAGSPERPDVPVDVLHGVLLMVGALYAHRGDDPLTALPRALLDPYKVYA